MTMKERLKAILIVLPVWVALALLLIFSGAVTIPVLADTPVEYCNMNLTNDPHAAFTDAVWQGSVVTDCSLSLYVGDSSWGNPFNEFEIWYQKSIANDEWIIFPIDTATYQYINVVYDRMGHADTLSCVLTDCDYASGTSVAPCEWIVYGIDYAGF